ncbi:hypothetical protein COLO4_12821 [Corchorus olitorius]|uniref:RNA helicase n=1 Tax=Corchorus olitorius TaxID=93759 RepID=A0A1R3JZH9_9ROSI|nr:hypothetical protein COLO4_12821 [Corchorus olitorius]
MANLPIVQFEKKILETVEQNPVVVIIGETGSGKSTQLSQMLHRKGYTDSGIVAVTQPRRVAAVSVSRRVAQELGVKLGEEDDIEKLVSKLEDKVRSLAEGSCMDAIILPLHGSLPPEMQVRVFNPPPPNCRRFIVATNIAETSLTVDGVVYVIDSGYVKQRQYNPATGMYSLDVVQISK